MPKTGEMKERPNGVLGRLPVPLSLTAFRAQAIWGKEDGPCVHVVFALGAISCIKKIDYQMRNKGAKTR